MHVDDAASAAAAEVADSRHLRGRRPGEGLASVLWCDLLPYENN